MHKMTIATVMKRDIIKYNVGSSRQKSTTKRTNANSASETAASLPGPLITKNDDRRNL